MLTTTLTRLRVLNHDPYLHFLNLFPGPQHNTNTLDQITADLVLGLDQAGEHLVLRLGAHRPFLLYTSSEDRYTLQPSPTCPVPAFPRRG